MARFWKVLGLVLVTGAGLAASVAVGSAATGAPTPTTTTTVAPPVNTGLPTVSGTARDGSLLTASNGRWTGSPTSYAYSWQRCDSAGGGCAAIAGANSRQYTVSSGDVGHRLRVEVTASNAGGSGSATSRPTAVVVASGNAPSIVRVPALIGTPQEGTALLVNRGSWKGSPPTTYDYTWQRCDNAGNNCVTFISHSQVTKYVLTSADVGHRMRIEVTATNSRGSTSVFSTPTAVVAPAKSTQSATTVAVSNVSLPDRLVIDQVHFSPNPIMSRNSQIEARFHVSDTKGLSVQGALVFALGLPYGWTYNAPEQATDANGWVTLLIRPTRNMPLRRGDLVMFVRARKPGDSLLAGVSTRRLVQAAIG